MISGLRRHKNALLIGAIFAVAGAAAPAHALTINAVFGPYEGQDFGIGPYVDLTGNAAATGMINRADALIEKQFTNNVTVNIMYVGTLTGPQGFLGASTTGQTVYSYNNYTAALNANSLANPNNKTLATAVANLGFGNGANDPNNTDVAVATDQARALGLNVGIGGDATPEFNNNGVFVGANGTVDGVVFLNLTQPLFYTRPFPRNPNVAFGYDAQRVMEHETDEVLGIGGTGSQLNNKLADPNYAQDFYGVNPSNGLFGPLDLYRYNAPHSAYFQVNGTTAPDFAYFSVDGGNTLIDTFNQQFMAFGDASDWGVDFSKTCPGGGFGGSGDVQDAFSCNNTPADVHPGAPSWKALSAIGWDPVPEPVTLSLFGAGLAGLATARRRKK